MHIGIILPNLGPNQLAFHAISEINRLASKTYNDDFTLFFEDIIPECVPPLCGVMSINEIWSFNGTLIATTLSGARSAIKATNASRKLFYIWDLEWIRRGNNNFLDNVATYRHPSLTLLARSTDHKKAIEGYCNKKVGGIMQDFDLEAIKGLSSRENS